MRCLTLAAFLSFIGCTSSPSTNPATANDNRGVRSDRDRAVASVVAIGELEQLTPDLVARGLGSRIARTEQVAAYRREYRLAPTALFASIDVIEGGQGPWRVVTLRPTTALYLVLEDFVPQLLEARYAMSVRTVHHRDGFAPDAVEHRFAVRAGALVVTLRRAVGGGTARGELEDAYRSGIDQATNAGHDVVESITVTTTRDIAPDAMTLREFRQWAAEHP